MSTIENVIIWHRYQIWQKYQFWQKYQLKKNINFNRNKKVNNRRPHPPPPLIWWFWWLLFSVPKLNFDQKQDKNIWLNMTKYDCCWCLGGCLEVVWCVSGRFLEGVSTGRCLGFEEGVCGVSGRCLEGVWGCMRDVWRLS